MSIISLQSSSFAASGAAAQVRKVQGEIKDYTGLLTRGVDVSGAKIATSSNVAVQQTQTKQWMENMQRLSNIMTTAITGLTEVQAQHKAMLELAEQVASGTKTADEIAILQKTFVQYQEAANAAAQNAEFLNDAILATDGGTAAAVGDAAAAISANGSPANSFDAIAINGNIFGSVEAVDVKALPGSSYNVVVTMRDAANGATYTLESSGSTVIENGKLNLVSSLDGQSSVQLTFAEDSDNALAGGSLSSASNYENALKSFFRLDNAGATNSSFVSGSNTVAGDYTISAADVTKGAGTYRISQSQDDLTKLTVVAPDGATETVTVPSNTDSVAKSYYAFGLRIQMAASGTAAALGGTAGENYTSFTVTGTSGYSRTVSAGSSASITVNISDHRNAALGVDSLSIDTIANATAARQKLTETIADMAKTLGELNAIAERAKSTMNNLGSTMETLGEVLGNIQNVDIVAMTELKLGATIQQMTAIDAFASDLRHRQQVMQTINQIG